MEFRRQINKVSEEPTGLWRLAKWAKDKSHLPREVPKMPTLQYENSTANTFEEKAEMLKNSFFPSPPEADLSDLQGYAYPPAHECPTTVTYQEVQHAIRRPKVDKTPGPDGITNRILRACSHELGELLTPLFQACVTQAYHPLAFREAQTVTLKKPGKPDYTTPKAYRPIALLNTLGEVLESIMANKIIYLAEKFELLPDSRMGARKNRSTESALELLTEQVHTVWGRARTR